MKILDGHLHTLAASYPKESYVFILASLVNSVGNSLMWPLTTIYVHNVLHRTYGEAGLVLLFQSLAMVVGQFVGGALFHKLGPKRLIVGSLVLTGLAQLGLIAAKLWVPYILTMTLAGFLNAITMPAVSAFIAFRWPNEQYRLFNAVYVSNNVGVAMGTALAGVLAAISFNLTFLFNGLTTILFGAFFYAFLRRFNREETEDFALGGLAQSRESNLVSLLKPYRLYLFVALGMAMVSLATSAWNSGVAPYLNQKGLSPAVYGFLWTVNGIVILVGQPVTSLLNRYLTQSLYARLVASAVLYCSGLWFYVGPSSRIRRLGARHGGRDAGGDVNLPDDAVAHHANDRPFCPVLPGVGGRSRFCRPPSRTGVVWKHVRWVGRESHFCRVDSGHCPSCGVVCPTVFFAHPAVEGFVVPSTLAFILKPFGVHRISNRKTWRI